MGRVLQFVALEEAPQAAPQGMQATREGEARAQCFGLNLVKRDLPKIVANPESPALG